MQALSVKWESAPFRPRGIDLIRSLISKEVLMKQISTIRQH